MSCWLSRFAQTVLFATVAAVSACASCTLSLPPGPTARSGTLPATLRFDHGLTGKGQVKLRWTDSLGRVVSDELIPVDLHDELDIILPVDLSRVVAMRNTLHADLALQEVTPKGIVAVQESADADFIARPSGGWNDYDIIMYQRYPASIQPGLQRIGINAGQVPGETVALPDALIDNNMRWYSEQIATDFYAEYHRYRADRPVNWSFAEAKALYAKDPSSLEAFKRHPSFWDPWWRSRIHDRLMEVTQRNFAYRPLFYSLSDESGIADLGAQWDFDLSDESLVPMRRWLREQYGSLAALNREWETNFSDWNAVQPFTTNQAMQRAGENFAPWGDFKNWMDYSYADALKMGVAAVHEADPEALAGIVGCQKPGWGGYDYDRLTRAVQVMEPYDIGESVKLAHSLNPGMPLLTTTFASGDWEKHRVWFELLQGERGLILWDDTQRYIRPDGSKGEAGKLAESYYNEIRDGVGALIINSHDEDDGIAVHYSQASMRTQWMLERRPDGAAWMTRDAQYERTHNDFLRLRESWGHAIEDQGLEYNFVSYSQVEQGELLRHGYHVLVLPQSSSLSAEEAQQMRAFVSAGGVLVADGMPGTFDEHSRRLPASSLADLFDASGTQPLVVHTYGRGKTILVRANFVNYLQDRLVGKEGTTAQLMAEIVRASDLHPFATALDDKGRPIVGLNVHRFADGGVQLLSFQSSPQQSVDELGPANFHSNERFAKEITVHVHLPAAMQVYDVRAKKPLGLQQNFVLHVDPYEPTILALASTPQPKLQVSMPSEAAAGSIVPLQIAMPGSPAATQVFHVRVAGPDGEEVLAYSGNTIVRGDTALRPLSFAKNDAHGEWQIQVHDLISGQTEARVLKIH